MKTLKRLTLVLTWIWYGTVLSQAQSLIPDFALNFLAGSDDQIQLSSVDKDNNLYLAGTFKSDTLFIASDTLLRAGDNDLFVIKLNQNSEVVYAKSFYNTGNSLVAGMVSDDLGHLYLTGSYKQEIRFGSNIFQGVVYPNVPYYPNSSFVTKMDANGSVVWAKSYGGNSSASSIAMDEQNNVYITGWFSESLQIQDPPTTVSAHYPDMYFSLKMDASGQDKWLKGYGGNKLVIDNGQNLYVVGSYMDSIHIDDKVLKTISNKENHNIFVAKVDTNAHVLWAKKFCEGEHALLNGALIDTVSNTLYLTGTYKTDTLTFSPIVIHNMGTADIFIAKLDTAANVLMVKTIGNEKPEYSWGLTRINSEHMALLGTSYSDSIQWGNYIIYGGNVPSPYGHFGNFFFAVFDNQINPVWASSFPISWGQALKSVVADGNDNVFIAGDFCGNSDVMTKSALRSTSPTYIEESSLFLVRFKQSALTLPFTPVGKEVLEIYPNPVSDVLNVKVDNEKGPFTLCVVNLAGQPVLEMSLPSGCGAVQVNQLPVGIYLLKVTTSTGQCYLKKFIKV